MSENKGIKKKLSEEELDQVTGGIGTAASGLLKKGQSDLEEILSSPATARLKAKLPSGGAVKISRDLTAGSESEKADQTPHVTGIRFI